MAGVVAGVLALLGDLPLIEVIGGGIIGIAIFWGAALLLKVEQAALFPRMILRRIRG